MDNERSSSVEVNTGLEIKIKPGGYVIVNDSRGAPDGKFVCGEEPVVYYDEEDAVKERDRLREKFDNPHINVYGVLLEKPE